MLLAFSSRANLPSIDTFSFLKVGLKEGSLFLESTRGDGSHLKKALGSLVALCRSLCANRENIRTQNCPLSGMPKIV